MGQLATIPSDETLFLMLERPRAVLYGTEHASSSILFYQQVEFKSAPILASITVRHEPFG